MLTTLNRIKSSDYLGDLSFEKLLRGLKKPKPDDDPVAITTILEIIGLGGAFACMASVEGYDQEMRQYAVDCVRMMAPSLIDYERDEQRAVLLLDTIERYAFGNATDDELAVAADFDGSGPSKWPLDIASQVRIEEPPCYAMRCTVGRMIWWAALGSDWKTEKRLADACSWLLALYCAEIEQREDAEAAAAPEEHQD